MATMNVSLPDPMKEWVESKVRDGGRYANVSDYVRDLIRKDKEYGEKLAVLREEVQKGIDSGLSDRTFDEIWASARERAKRANAAD